MGRSIWGVTGGSRPTTSEKNTKNIGFRSNRDLDPLKNHKATKPALNVWPSLAPQQNAIEMAFRWWADNGLL